MATYVSYSVGFFVLMFASMMVLAQQNDPCTANSGDCIVCVNTTFDTNKTCIFAITTAGRECTNDSSVVAEGVSTVAHNAAECAAIPSITNQTTTTVAPNTTTTSTAPTTTPNTTTPTTSATTVAPTTNATTTASTTTTTVTPTTNATTIAPPPSTSTTPTPAPSNGSTTAAPEPAPKSGGMSVASFFGGIVFTLGVSAVGYLVWRFYKVRMDRNYHTLSTNLI